MESTMLRRIFLFLFIAHTGCQCLRLTGVTVPRYILKGELVLLECQYELDGDTLYSVKWYKETEEFYRFVPRSSPPQTSYRVEGIKVDHHLSNSEQVALRSVNLKSSGVYRCEVNAEAPSFSSGAAEARMTVIYPPQNGPKIWGEQTQYLIGDEVNLNCTSGHSYPASILHWFINDLKITDERELIRYPETVHPHGLVSTVLGLSTRVEPKHFQKGSMRLRCVASLAPVLSRGVESVVGAPLLDNREAMLLVNGAERHLPMSIIVLLNVFKLLFI